MITLNQAKCSGCRMCMQVCPHQVFVYQDKKAVLLHGERCIECGACQLNCHYQAITVTKGTGCLWLIIREHWLFSRLRKGGCDCG